MDAKAKLRAKTMQECNIKIYVLLNNTLIMKFTIAYEVEKFDDDS